MGLPGPRDARVRGRFGAATLRGRRFQRIQADLGSGEGRRDFAAL